MTRLWYRLPLIVAGIAFFFTAVGIPAALAEQTTLELYCGRSKSLVEPVIKYFEQKHPDIKVNVRYGNTPQLALALKTEGKRTPADVFWAQDAGALGEVAREGLLVKLADDTFKGVADWARPGSKRWVGTSGRARVLGFSPKLIDEKDLPQSVFDLTDSKWKGKVGWAPTNGSFQAFVTAMRKKHGDAKTKEWLLGMKANEPKAYPKNTPIVQALADGEITVGLPNHYYLLRFKAKDADFPAAQTFFKDGDIGNLVFVAGMGVVKHSHKQDAAEKFVRFMLSRPAQKYFTLGVFEYPVVENVERSKLLVDHKTLNKAAPKIDADELTDLEGTLNLLREVGLL